MHSRFGSRLAQQSPVELADSMGDCSDKQNCSLSCSEGMVHGLDNYLLKNEDSHLSP